MYIKDVPGLFQLNDQLQKNWLVFYHHRFKKNKTLYNAKSDLQGGRNRRI